MNIILAAAGFMVSDTRLAYVNTALAAFNLLPAGKTDGWNIIYHLMIQRYDELKTEKVLKFIGVAFLMLMYFAGFMILLNSGYNFSVIAAAIYITIIFLK